MNISHGGDIFGIARAHGWDWREVLDMSASINPLGPSPAVRPAIEAALDRIAHYPEPEPVALREDLARLWGVDPRQILPGNGATELLHFHARTSAHERVTLAVPTFSEFHRAYPDAAFVPWADPLEWPSDGLLVLTQPNSPIGDCLPFEQLALAATSRAGSTLIDESFLDFTGERSAMGLTARAPRLLVLRSLTKFHALPGLRIGALVGAVETIEELRRLREPWQVNVLAEAAARAAIADFSHAEATFTAVRAENARLAAALAAMPGLEAAPSRANYVFVRCALAAAAWRDAFLTRKILIRVCTGDPGVEGEAFRVAVRTPAENERFLAAAREIIACL